MKRFIKKITALLIILLMTISYCSQVFAYTVYLINTRSNGSTYTDYRHDNPVFQDYYVDNLTDYSYFCLKGGEKLRDAGSYMSGTYSNLAKFEESSFKNNQELKWLIKNMYVEGTDVDSEKYMLAHLNNIIKKYAANGYKECTVDSLDTEFIEVIEQMAIWSFVENKYTTYDYNNLIKSEADMGKIGGYTAGTAGQKNAYALFTALINGAKDRKYSVEESTESYELEVERGNNFELKNISGNTYTMGPITINKTSSPLVENLTDSIDIKTTGDITYLNSTGTSQITINNKTELIGKTFYIQFTTESAIADGKTVRYTAKADLGYRISALVANVYSETGRQPILQVKKQLKANQSGDSVSVTKPTTFDIALTKQIISVEHNGKLTDYSRLKERTPNPNSTSDKYIMDKKPINVQPGDYVNYRITVYNEGTADAYIQQISDLADTMLSAQIFGYEIKTGTADDRNVNIKSTWNVDSDSDYDVITVTQSGLGYVPLLPGESFYIDLQYKVDSNVIDEELINYAAVTKYGVLNANKDAADKEGVDIDSEQNDTLSMEDYEARIKAFKKRITTSAFDKNLASFQDDDDFEIVKVGSFDMALRKFITSVNGKNLEENREPTFTVRSAAALAKDGTAKYYHTKDPVTVSNGDRVIYTIRVYNEGSIDGYAKEITDYLPEGLELAENSEINSKYGWVKGENVNGATPVTTKYLETTLLNAGNDGDSIVKGLAMFGENKNYTGIGVEPKYVDEVQIECKVTSNDASKLVNVAEITSYGYNNLLNQFQDAKNTEGVDRDSQGNNVITTDKSINDYYENVIKDQLITDKTEYHGEQDDDDFEILQIEPLDLALRKFITSINGTDLETSREPKFNQISVLSLGELGTATYNHPKNPISVNVGDRVIYTIRVYNEGFKDGYAEEITDYLPVGLKYVDEEFNQSNGWTVTENEDGTTTVKTSVLSDTLISAGNDGEAIAKALAFSDETGTTVEPKFMAEVQIECEVTAQIGGKLVNVAEITKYGYKDANGEMVYASTKGIDRDSEQNNVFNTNKTVTESINEYFARIDYSVEDETYYRGVQDDDDFEVVEVAPNEKIKGQYGLEIEKVDTKNNKLSGVTFNVNGTQTQPTGEDGKVTIFTNKEITEQTVGEVDTYTIGEIKVAEEYVSLAEELTVYVSKKQEGDTYVLNKASFAQDQEVTTKEAKLKDGTTVTVKVTVTGNVVTVTIPNKPVEEKEGKYSLEIEKVDTKNNKLSGVTFKVNDKLTQATGEDGKVTVIENKAISKSTVSEVDTYTISEINVSEKYVSLDEELTVYVTKKEDEKAYTLNKVSFAQDQEVTTKEAKLKDGTTVNVTVKVEGDVITITVPNKPVVEKYGKYSLEIEKIDTYNNKLSGVTFKVNDKSTEETGEDGKVTVIENKEINKSTVSEVDTYTISEVNVSEKYVSLDEELTIYVTKKEDEKAYTLDKVSFAQDQEVTTKEAKLKDGTTVNVTVKVEGDVITVTVPNKPQNFDLALRKWVTKAIVTEDGKTTVTETGHKAEDDPEDIVKVEIHRKKLNSVVVKFEYQIRVTNEGTIAGYAREISDYIPEGLKFVQEDNPTWKEANGKVTTDELYDTLLQPGESAEVTIVLTWMNAEDNMGLKINTAEISDDYNEFGEPDIDSTPNNKVPGEDDIDDAPVMLTISTGRVITYFAITLGVLTILGFGIVAIKKYVL